MQPTPFSRRDFGLALMTSATTVALTPTSEVIADEKPKSAMPVPASQDDEPREIPEPVYLLGAILKHYPDKRLDEAAITGILKDINGDLARGRVLSNFPLKNSDEPGYVFRAWRQD